MDDLFQSAPFVRRGEPRGQGLHFHRDARESLHERVVQFPGDAAALGGDGARIGP